FLPQARRALENIVAIVQAAGGRSEHVARITWYVIDADDYRSTAKELGAIYREIFGSHYPAMSLLVVAALLEPGARVEIEATAILES
ncbi:MAG: RidA family protein, partial [Vulcanimicrobiaceae bacterium]